MKTISTTIVVDFTSDDENSGSVLKVEIDAREDGFNEGDTSFSALDEPVYLLYKTKNVLVDYHENTLVEPNGVIVLELGIEDPVDPPLGEPQVGEPGYVEPPEVPVMGYRDLEQLVVFACSDRATTNYPVDSGFTYEWLGVDPGVAITVENQTQLTVPKEIIAVARISYSASFLAYRMTNTPESINERTDYTVLTFITGHDMSQEEIDLRDNPPEEEVV